MHLRFINRDFWLWNENLINDIRIKVQEKKRLYHKLTGKQRKSSLLPGRETSINLTKAETNLHRIPDGCYVYDKNDTRLTEK